MERKERLEYTPFLIEQIPNQYPDNSFSIKGFLAVKEQYDNQFVNIRGIIKNKYICGTCPKGAPCKKCESYIVLADPLINITAENELLIDFFKDEEIYQTLKLGEIIVMNVKYNSENLRPVYHFEYQLQEVAEKNGYFVYNSIYRGYGKSRPPITP